ncbi:nicotinamidase-related amidase [Streptomyces sp. KhCrAH-43]|uniref:cysteine hydrolase family protein n=1 Tax=unclassified Streptomyces TaxID=2593676 RepID=UPI00036927E6|nr:MULTISPECIES: isochorismatase family cysteine hydrolase [unclassified Streptomyces]MYS37502.1 isochorismatase family protein [Streptomyces sp. SID4920]MYX67935.1 isochorismatase family protein [Streptomyces sp. SID8373]RAJ56894.1 nicotinamidase-related amidase [Streptomyces sp. KhCrAH-43]
MTRPALLVMDLQRAVVGRVADLDAGFTPRLARAVAAARKAEVPVVHVVVGFRPGHPEAKSSPLFGALPEGAFTDADPGSEIHPDLTPLPREAVVTKKRVSAFTGSDLDLVLRGAGVGHLVLTGLSTSGVVLSTLRQAADLDYRLTVLADGCADRDPEVHRVLTEKVFPHQAEVTTVDTWIRGLG